MPLREDRKFSTGQNLGSSQWNRKQRAQASNVTGVVGGETANYGTRERPAPYAPRMRRSLPAMQPAPAPQSTRLPVLQKGGMFQTIVDDGVEILNTVTGGNTGPTNTGGINPDPDTPAPGSGTAQGGYNNNSSGANNNDIPIVQINNPLEGIFDTADADQPEDLVAPVIPTPEYPGYDAPAYTGNPNLGAYNATAQQAAANYGGAAGRWNEVTAGTNNLGYGNAETAALQSRIAQYLNQMMNNNPFSQERTAQTVADIRAEQAMQGQDANRRLEEQLNSASMGTSGMANAQRSHLGLNRELQTRQAINDYLTQQESERAGYQLQAGQLGISGLQTMAGREKNMASFDLDKQRQLIDIATTRDAQSLQAMAQAGQLSAQEYAAINEWKNNQAVMEYSAALQQAIAENDVNKQNALLQAAAESGNYEAVLQIAMANANAQNAQTLAFTNAAGNIVGAGTGAMIGGYFQQKPPASQ